MTEEFKEVIFVKIDVDDQGCGDIVDKYDVNVMPTFLFIKGQKLLVRFKKNLIRNFYSNSLNFINFNNF